MRSGLISTMNTDKTYKYYIFYLIDDDDSEIYAYTDEKVLYKRFKNERNENIFRVRKEYLTKEQVNLLAKRHPMSRLMVMEGYTKEIGKPGIPVPLTLVVTESEEMSIISTYDSLINHDIFTISHVNPFIFNKKIFDALNYIDYVYNYLYMCDPEKVDELYPNFQFNYDIDIFGAFMDNFGKYSKIGG